MPDCVLPALIYDENNPQENQSLLEQIESVAEEKHGWISHPEKHLVTNEEYRFPKTPTELEREKKEEMNINGGYCFFYTTPSIESETLKDGKPNKIIGFGKPPQTAKSVFEYDRFVAGAMEIYRKDTNANWPRYSSKKHYYPYKAVSQEQNVDGTTATIKPTTLLPSIAGDEILDKITKHESQATSYDETVVLDVEPHTHFTEKLTMPDARELTVQF